MTGCFGTPHRERAGDVCSCESGRAIGVGVGVAVVQGHSIFRVNEAATDVDVVLYKFPLPIRDFSDAEQQHQPPGHSFILAVVQWLVVSAYQTEITDSNSITS